MEPTIRLTTAAGEDKPLVRMFLCYANLDAEFVWRFWGLLDRALQVDRTYRFEMWVTARSMMLGDDWDNRIRDALARCELGLLAISNAFLTSKYITNVELPALLGVSGKRVIPVAVRQISRHADWHGLDSKHVYGRKRPYSSVRGTAAQDVWVNELVDQIHQVLARYGDNGSQRK
jgi:transposase InsO family protein